MNADGSKQVGVTDDPYPRGVTDHPIAVPQRRPSDSLFFSRQAPCRPPVFDRVVVNLAWFDPSAFTISMASAWPSPLPYWLEPKVILVLSGDHEIFFARATSDLFGIWPSGGNDVDIVVPFRIREKIGLAIMK